MKCSTCRQNDVELLTPWERVRNWLYLRMNYVFFPEDFNDTKSEMYTKGISDGNIQALKWSERQKDMMNKEYGK